MFYFLIPDKNNKVPQKEKSKAREWWKSEQERRLRKKYLVLKRIRIQCGRILRGSGDKSMRRERWEWKLAILRELPEIRVELIGTAWKISMKRNGEVLRRFETGEDGDKLPHRVKRETQIRDVVTRLSKWIFLWFIHSYYLILVTGLVPFVATFCHVLNLI